MIDQPSQSNAGDDEAVRLLRLAGPRPSVSDERAQRVREAVRLQWHRANGRRTTRKRMFAGIGTLAAAAVLLFVARTVVIDRSRAVVDRRVAVVERVDGIPRIASGGRARTLSPNEAIGIGEWIETASDARVALRFPDGTSVRVDVGSRVRPLAPDLIELISGALYVDTGRTVGHFAVRTALGTARDIGTQFEVRLVGTTEPSLRLRVRTGIVELTGGGRSVSGRGGTEVTFSSAGTVSRPLAPHGPEWEWTASLAPPMEIEGQALSTFLSRLAHEHGWHVRYADSALARDAAGIILHGSVRGLSSQDALDVAVATSGLGYRLEHGELVIMGGSGRKKGL